MRQAIVVVAVLMSLMTLVVHAQESRQIRLDENTCKNIIPEYVRKKSNPLYAKALAAQKSGHANDMQKYRIREVRFLYDTLKFAKCKGV